MNQANKIVLSLATALVLSNSVYAQDVSTLDAITVTANKIEENIQDIPQSITVIDEVMLEEKGIKNISDVINEIPNMRTGHSSGVEVNFRGLNVSTFTNNNPVVIYIDGVATSSRYGFDASMVNVERIEVLRGPQGTLYGKDAIGAVINVITKNPTNTTTGTISLEYGSENYKQGTFNINTPLVKDKLYLGVNAEISSDDGWITNDYNGDAKVSKEKDYRLSTSLLYKVNNQLSTKLMLNKEQTNDYFDNRQRLAGANDISKFSRDDAKHVTSDMPTHEKNDITSQSFDITYRANDFTLNSVTTHKKSNFVGTYDADFSNTSIEVGLSQYNNFEEEIYTQEFRISSNNAGIRWIGGIYLDKEDRIQKPYGFEFPNYDPVTFAYIGNYFMNADSKTENTTQAVFGQTMIPFSEKFEVTLGGRLQKITKKMDQQTYFAPLNTTAAPIYTLNEKKSWNTFLPKVALTYKISENFTQYVSVSKGYMPGGYNYFASSGTADDNSFEPQETTNYEVGIKGVLNDVSFSASIFKMNITDLHVYEATGGGVYLTSNAKKAHSQGIEFDFNYFPTDNLEISGAIGFIEAKYDDYDTGTTKFDGETIEKTPSHTANLSVAYHHPSGYYGRVDVKNSGEVNYHDDGNNKFVKDDGYTLANIKAGYRVGQFDMYAYVKNLTNEEYINTYFSTSSQSVVTFNDPRMIGVGLKYKF